MCRNQEPITLVASEPEPDVAVIRSALQDYQVTGILVSAKSLWLLKFLTQH